MSRQDLASAIEKFANDKEFREQVRADRATAVMAAGYDLTKEEQDEINNLGWDSKTDDDLIQQIGTVQCHA